MIYGYDCRDRLTSEEWQSTVENAPPPPCGNNPQNLTPGNLSAFTDPVCATPTNGAPILHTASWEYDGSGNRTRQTENATVTDYAYDAQNRLTTETRGGNVVVSYTYDKNGNQATRLEGGVEERFSYDYMNRIEFYEKGPAGTPTTQFMYSYMPTGERVAKVNLLDQAQEWFMYDGQDVTADYSRSGGTTQFSLLRTYVNGRAIDSKIARIEAGGAIYFYAGDAIGSVHEMIATDGTIVRQSLYTAWGQDLPGFTGISFADRHAFSQRERDPESALMHYRARSYDPRTGRFVQKDGVLSSRVHKAYNYAGNDPVRFTDPSGMQEFEVGSDGVIRPVPWLRRVYVVGSDGSFTPDFELVQHRPPQSKVAVHYSDPLGVLNAIVFEKFQRIVTTAVKKDVRPFRVNVEWEFKPGPRPGRLGKISRRQYTAYVETIRGAHFKSDRIPGAAGTGAFYAYLYSKGIDYNMKQDPNADRDIFLANVLVHELVFHAIGSEFDYWGWFSSSETANALDLTFNEVQVEWLTQEGFLPTNATSEFIDEIEE